MSTPEQPDTPSLTRKQLREIRQTGATPIISADAVPAVAPETESPASEPGTESSGHSVPAESSEPVIDSPPDFAPPAPLPRAAVPAAIGDLPVSDASVDLGVSPLTRRQARQQERIRTASVPVITPEIAAAHAATTADAPSEADSASQDQADTVFEEVREPLTAVPEFTAEVVSEGDHEDSDEQSSGVDAAAEPGSTATAGASDADSDTSSGERAILNPQFGAELLAGEVEQVALPPSFDQLISRSVTGSIGTGNALILSQAPSGASPLVAPVAATGEVLITGTFNLPEGLGSTGHANGAADGREADAALADQEIPAHSSPTPIAASAAISTVKNAGDIITPPTPEKGGRLMMTLAITAGVLALALVGVLILAFATGVFA